MEMNKFVVFSIGNAEYAFPIRWVVSIEKAEKINTIPQLPQSIMGIVKVRETLIPVLDFESILYHKRIEVSDTTKLIVIQTDQEAMKASIAVNEAKEILEISSEQINQVSLIVNIQTPYISGIANLGSRLITIIDPLKLLTSLEDMKQIEEYIQEYV
ncbi:chemotaxis protein CheW [Bacillus sp. 03113]|uniref:chemotaxis protein CheW n=1 Tax=Bacillus sp. 03113 TaxID=2578211 RepID=UPI001141C039|nr:chemotaxis protein CheW [Bacillus sp. 03113]